MMAEKHAAAPTTPSEEEIAQQLGVDLASEPELFHIVSKMRTTPLPPTWRVENTSISDHETSNKSLASTDSPACSSTNAQKMEYVNCVTKVRTPQHPGTPYFLAVVESERRSSKRHGRGDAMTTYEPTPPLINSSVGSIDGSSSPPIPQDRQQPGDPCPDVGSEGASSERTPAEIATILHQQAIADTDKYQPSEVHVVYKEAQNVTAPKMASTSVVENGAGAGPHSRKRPSTERANDGKRRIPMPKWLVFTSWWHETKSGVESTLSRKHASIRYAISDGSFEIELEDIPAIFEVSHANGRHGKIGTVDIRVGAQLSILGRQMTLMQ
ncbi:unnamed protein product, partial [Hapterophycus canaliculatus]